MLRIKQCMYGKLVCVLAIASAPVLFSQAVTAAIDIRAVALTGGTAPDMPPGTTFTLLTNGSYPVISNSGRVAFQGNVIGFEPAPFVASGIWTDTNGDLSLVVLDGQHAPGTGVEINFQNLGRPQLDAAGHVSFDAGLTGPGIDLNNNSGVWSDAGGSIELVAREGAQAPGYADGVTFHYLAEYRTNTSGQTMLSARVAGPGIDFSNDSAIWIHDAGTLTLHQPGGDAPIHTLFPGYGPPVSVMTGDVAPGITPAVEFMRIEKPVTNSAGQVVFQSFLAEPGSGTSSTTSIWLEDGGILRNIARAGQQAPGVEPGGNFNILSQFNYSLNANAQVAFKADMVGPGIHGENRRGIWIDTDGDLELAVRSGTQAPGTPSGIDFYSFEAIGLNDQGTLAFGGTLTGVGVDSTNDQGIWLNVDGVLKLIAREGDALEVAPGDIRTISTLRFDPTNDDNGVYSGLNDQGHLTFTATFSDGSSGIFVATPEPTNAGLCLVATSGYLLKRRRITN